jgi:hypothetical protein
LHTLSSLFHWHLQCILAAKILRRIITGHEPLMSKMSKFCYDLSESVTSV